MRARVVDLVVCPTCFGRLVLHIDASEGEEIERGTLTCASCSRRYPIAGGVPRLVPAPDSIPEAAQRTVDRFGDQWNEFDFIGPHYERQFLAWVAPNGPETFAGKVVLEGGCGKGRHSALASKYGAKDVLAIDLGSAVEAAYRNVRAYPNVHVIQADLFHLPVAPGTVDLAFSIGVLHHTPDPKRCFLEIVKRVVPGGRMIAWVYGRENNGWIVHAISPIREALTSRLPHRWVYELSKVPALALYAVGKGLYQPLSRGPLAAVGKRLFYQAYVNQLSTFPFDEVHSIVHDHLTPPIAHYIRREEFEAWFREADLDEVAIAWHNQNSWRGTGIQKRSASVRSDGGATRTPPSSPAAPSSSAMPGTHGASGGAANGGVHSTRVPGSSGKPS